MARIPWRVLCFAVAAFLRVGGIPNDSQGDAINRGMMLWVQF
jgi:hypothetical protein